MKKTRIPAVFVATATLFFTACSHPQKDALLLKDVTLIDGTGASPVLHTDILIKGDTVAAIGKNLDSSNATVVMLQGKTVMPTLISAHSHIGVLKGTTSKPENYTHENILSQLKKYQDYGVLHVMALGSDLPYLFESGIRDSSAAGLWPGARLHTAGYGFSVPDGMPPMDHLFRPANVAQVSVEMDSLKQLHPDMVKMWVDDFGGKAPKMKPAIYKAIIDEAHKRQLRVAAHVYHLADLQQLVADGIDVIAHSVRDAVIDDTTIAQMRAKHIIYIPTLSLDEFAYIYADKPEWINDAFFRKSLEPGVYEMITSEKFQNDLKNDPALAKNTAAFQTALKNLKKVYAAGILVALGTDSGATPLRAQGFSEHLELELLVQAGLTPLQAITAATFSAARALKVAGKSGTVTPGKTADLLIVDGDPLSNIKNTRNIVAVYKAGKEVSKGPLSK
ncbi:MAG TPA: amidohydrolase family protein [Chitinophaga sp.]|uniref:amidohydrolase family protein n=1 Tax=Chitinophaga sp. TaxID=1869181 RepID=UPI002B556EBE|nr:amidohydrolase family protein [Chitinophaga sp.]HVI43732.1 amidohydrolase family protein [Chitinophaga sp.]